MTRHPVSARGRKTTATGRDRESVGWRMWCDEPGCAESSETRPTQHDLPLAEFAAAGWHVAEKWGDICPTCLAKGVKPRPEDGIEAVPAGSVR